jgi:CDP-glycerol glycerophosphotransferase
VPDISVVVIVYNDAARLPAAVRSVLGQTLRNLEVLIVDDCSTDATPQVAAKLAAESPRVRSLRLERNSGGCSAPRNEGIEQARGRYVMFLDSDDTLDRHACLNLLQTAEETGADLVSGVCVRVLHNRSGLIENVPWWPEMYAERRVLDGVAQMPDLLRDTLSTNKLYRRGLLEEHELRFPVGFHYEDLLFSAKAYLAADRIALIPQTVYRWNVAVRAAERSISNRRDQIGNVRDRVRIHELIDEALTAWLATPAGDREVKIAKDAKFIEHDLVLYLRDLPYQDPAYIAEFSELMRGYLATLSPEAFERCPHRVAVAGAFLLLRDDWDNLVTVSEHLLDRTRDSAKHLETTRITSDLMRDGEHIYWCQAHTETDEGRAALDVTSLGLHRVAFAQANLASRLTGLERLPGSSGRVRLSGETVNPLGLIPPDAQLSAAVEFRPAARAVRSYRIKAREVRHEGSRIAWSLDVDLTKKIKPLGLIDQVWELKLRLTSGSEGTSVSKVTALKLPGEGAGHEPTFPARPLLTRAVGDEWIAGISHRGAVTFTLAARNPVARAVNSPFAKATSSRGGRLFKLAQKLNRRAQILNDPRIKREVYNKVLLRLPVRRGSVVFESHLGRSYSDNPKYIHLALRAAGHKGRVYWSHAGGTGGFPSDARLVKRGSWGYLRALARAEFWVDNQGFPQWIRKRPGTTYIQTWHGTALKTMGVNTPQVKAMLTADRKKLAAAVGRFDHFLVRSAWDIRTLVEAFEMRAEPLRVGYPRNDPLCATDREEKGAQLRKDLGIPADRKVLLYAPTFRRGSAGSAAVFEPGFDLLEFARRFGETHVLLVRAHYLNRVEVPSAAGGTVRDVSAHPDVTELMLASDALITDYSSVMFDYALLDRPLLFFTPDADAYAQDRGTYFDLAERAPGPITADQDALFAAIDAIGTTDAYAQARKSFAHDFGEYDTGTAAARVVEKFFKRGGAR